MLAFLLIALSCHLGGEAAGQVQEVRLSFCPSNQLVGAACDSSTPVEAPPPNTFESQVNHLRCQSGCLMDEQLNFLRDFAVDEEEIWPSFNLSSLGSLEEEKLDVCRRNCLIYTVFKDILNQILTEAQCQSICAANSQPLACLRGCSIGSRLFEHETADNPDLVPVQPTQTPPIFFDPQSPAPWEFILNLSAVTPTSQMRPNFTRPVIHGFVLQIIVEQNGVNITDNHYMSDASYSGSADFSTFLSTFRCHVMYLSFGVVNFYGRTNLTEFTRTCIPGTYSLLVEPRFQGGSYLVNQGSLPNPSLGSITLNWFPPQFSPLNSYPTYEVSAKYIRQSAELDSRCQPGGGDVEFRQGNLSDIFSFTIESGPHGNIQLLPPGVGPCVYRVTLEVLWVNLNVTIPFLQSFRQKFTADVNVVYVSSDTPLVKVNASLSSESADGLYLFDNASFVVLDPPVEYFYDSFNAINWTIVIACFNSSSGEISDVHLMSVIEEFTPTMQMFRPFIPLPDSVRNVKLPPLESVNSFYFLRVQVIRDERFPAVRRDYLPIPITLYRLRFSSTMTSCPLAPKPPTVLAPPNCTFDYCTMNKGALCTNPAAEGDCTNRVIVCSACYFAKERRPLPAQCNPRRHRCAGLTGAELQSCLKRWGRCVKVKHGQTPRRRRKPKFFLCHEFPCQD